MTTAALLPTEPPPPEAHCCRCPDVAPWHDWVEPHEWIDADGRLIESRSCATCGCTRSVVKVTL